MGREFLGLIPARGGSKGIPGKNLTLLAGRPLIDYTFQAARESRHLTRIVLSTDDPRIADAAQAAHVEVPFLRPPELAQDSIPMLPVIMHALDFLSRHDRYTPDAVVLLQPTSPLRTVAHIDGALELLTATGCDSVVSVCEVPHRFNPVSVLRLEGGRLVPFLQGEGARVTQRQEKPRVLARNGPAVVVTRTRVLRESGRLYGDDNRPFLMTEEESVDIDGPLDLLLAESILRRRGG